jgi:formylmethanofuran dehydrogenase subunit E
MDNEDLFEVMPVEVELRPHDMPGRPLTRIRCDACGEHVQDGREVRRQGVVLCKACSGNSYYRMEKASLCGERYAK